MKKTEIPIDNPINISHQFTEETNILYSTSLKLQNANFRKPFIFEVALKKSQSATFSLKTDTLSYANGDGLWSCWSWGFRKKMWHPFFFGGGVLTL